MRLRSRQPGRAGGSLKEDVLKQLDKGTDSGGNGKAAAPAAPPPVKTALPPPVAARAIAPTGDGDFDAKGVKRVATTKIR